MFNPSRWRTEKTKIGTLFKFQFHATQIPKLGLEAMVVTLVPPDAGRPAARLEKTTFSNGACDWEEPVYVTVKLSQNLRTGKIDDKIYQLRVSATISSESRVLGEITINLADYAEAFKPFSVSFPLKASTTRSILHVTLQRMPGDVERRYGDGNGDVTVRKQRKTLLSQLSKCEDEDGGKVSDGLSDIVSTEIGPLIIARQEGAKSPSGRQISLHADSNDELRKSSSFDTISASSSDTSSGQFTPEETGIKQDSAVLLSPSVSSAHNGIMCDSRNSSGEAGSIERSQESNDDPNKLRIDLALKKQLHLAELELLTLRKQVVKEKRRGEDLSNELTRLKGERDASRRECEALKASQKRRNAEEKVQFNEKDLWSMLEDIKEELNNEKNLNANLCLQLKKSQESNSELNLAVRDLEYLLEQKNSESCINERHSSENGSLHRSISKSRQACMRELCIKDNEDIEMQMEQLALDYEILKQENHYISSKLEQMQLREQLTMQYECSAHLAIINDLEVHVENLEMELQKQVEALEDELEIIVNAKVELEKRAIRTEEALRKTKANSANTAERLQEELKVLSVQMASTFYANEKMLMQALAESSELYLQKSHLEEQLEKSNRELESVKDQCHAKLQQLLSLVDFKTKEADMLLKELRDNQKEIERRKASSEEMIRRIEQRDKNSYIGSDSDNSKEVSSLYEKIQPLERS